MIRAHSLAKTPFSAAQPPLATANKSHLDLGVDILVRRVTARSQLPCFVVGGGKDNAKATGVWYDFRFVHIYRQLSRIYDSRFSLYSSESCIHVECLI